MNLSIWRSTGTTHALLSLDRSAVRTYPGLARGVSSSPYGRTHVWRRRPPALPNPIVPQFPQRVILADGSTFVHWTTSPRATLKLTRDTTNNPVWNPWLAGSNPEDVEGASAGRLGRFRRKFEELGGTEMNLEWMGHTEEEVQQKSPKRESKPSSSKTAASSAQKK